MLTSTTLQHTKFVTWVLGAAVAFGMSHAAPAEAQTHIYTETASYCKGKQPDGSPNPCAALVYGNGSGYNVAKVVVEERDNKWDQNPNCSGVKLSDANDLMINQYGVFVVPAPCAYKLTIHIAGGDTKGEQVFVTPGCQMVLESKGTTTASNDVHIKKIVWTDDAKNNLKDKGITVSDADVSDMYFHKTLGQSSKHWCNKIDKANQNPKS